MSGHSKWHNIQKTKGAQDAKRAAAFTKIAKEMYVAVKEGGGSTDPNYNSRLATVITKAKAANMPNDNIKRVLEKAANAGSGDAYEAITYEGYGPGGVAVIVEALTDNRQRTAPEIRHYFDKYGGNMGAANCVSWSFDRKGVIVIDNEDEELDEDTVMMDALDAGAADFEADGEVMNVYTAEDAKKYPPDEVEVIDGKLTGMVRGHTHFWLWGQVEYTEPQQRKAAMKSQKQCLELGITSVGDMGECDAPSYHIMQKMCRDGDFKIRSYMALHSIFGKPFSLEDNEHFLKLGFMTGLGDEHFRVGPCKFMIDGGTGGPSCATREPYSHDPELPRERGWEREESWDYIKRINDAECQCTAHAVGDLAIEFMVEGYERCFAENPERVRALRHRIEHCVIVDPDLIARMAKMNICPILHTGLVQMLGKNFSEFYGPERNKYLEAVRSMLDAGIHVALHSDAPSGPVGVQVIDGAVNRYDRSKNFQCDRTQAVSVLEAIRCYTLNSAYAAHEDHIKGSIEVGKLADLIILSDDILAIDPMDIHSLKVDLTMIDGVVEYER